MGLIDRTFYRIIVAGQDISATLHPILLDVSVTLTSGGASDQASFTIDDTDGRVRLPRDDADVTISLGNEAGVSEVFRGKVNDVGSSGSRSGRTLQIGCTGMDTKGKAREPQDRHYDDKTVDEILQQAAKAAGLSGVSVDAEMGKVKLGYVLQQGESFVALGERFARMLGGTFKVAGKQAVMVKRNAGRSASGKPLLAVKAIWGDNLISWEIEPLQARPRNKTIQTAWYDQKAAAWKTEKKDTPDTQAKAIGRPRFAHGGKEEAKQRAASDAEESDRNKGGGTAVIQGAPQAQPEATCTVSGARSGVDGSYLIDAVAHSLSRSGGFTTSLTLKRPGDGAGKDNR